ncbi:hypothetical protein ACE6H2_013338 [Prunus campanulata]
MALQWRLSEEALLMRAVKKYGILSWKSVSESVGTRSARECKYRWYQCLDPRVKMCWTPEEDRELESLHVMLPNRWTSISDTFNGSRTASQCQIRHKHLFPPAMPVPMFNPDDASPDLSPELVEPYAIAPADTHTPDPDLKKKKPILVVESKSKSESALYCLSTLCRYVKVVDHQSKASSSTKVDPKLGKKRRIDDVKQPLPHSPEPEPERNLGLNKSASSAQRGWNCRKCGLWRLLPSVYCRRDSTLSRCREKRGRARL